MERSYLVSGDVTTDRHLVTNEEIESHPYFTQFLAKFGLKWIAAVGLSPDSHIDVAISVQGATSRGPFSDRELEVLGALGAHAERSLRLSVRIFDQQLARATLQQALERLNIGVFALDSNCRVLFSNSAAEGMMGDGIAVLNRKLVLRPMNEDVGALDNAVRSLATDKRAPKPIMVRGPNPGRLLACYVLPSLKGPTQPFIGSRVFVLLVDSRPGDRPDPAILRDLLDLTLGEARVAAVVGLGMSPREAAAKLGLTEETVRTALKRVFSKAGVSSQSELTALLTRLILR